MAHDGKTSAVSRMVNYAIFANILAILGLVVASVIFGKFIQLPPRTGNALFNGLMFVFLCTLTMQIIAGLIALGFKGIRLKGALSALVGMFFVAGGFMLALGAAWGRPLRVNGKTIHPELEESDAWARGALPNAAGLAEADKQALGALWLHDAKKEHASAPAFSKVAWLLAAAGSPPELMRRAHFAAIQEIEHARLCFALASGYLGKEYGPKPMPALTSSALAQKEDALAALALESFADGCLLEDFNADVAEKCAEICKDDAVRAALARIAKEERSHAQLSWDILAWTLESDPEKIAPLLEGAIKNIEKQPRPTAVSVELLETVAAADKNALRRHGRLDDADWQKIWQQRLQSTRAKALHMAKGGQLADEYAA